MEKKSYINEVKEAVAEQMGKDIKTLKRSTRVVEDLGADSLDVVELLMTLEDEFKITIPEEKIADLKTIGDIVDYVNSTKGK